MGRIAKALNDAREPYMVIGGQAVNHHGRVRVTKDIDFTMAVAPWHWQRVIGVLNPVELEPMVDKPNEWVMKTHVLPLQTKASSLRVDISFTDSPYETQAIARGEDVMVSGVPVRFCSVEDLLIHKLIAGRMQDLIDVRTVLLKNPDADLDDVRLWLGRFEEVLETPLLERLKQALRDAGR